MILLESSVLWGVGDVEQVRRPMSSVSFASCRPIGIRSSHSLSVSGLLDDPLDLDFINHCSLRLSSF